MVLQAHSPVTQGVCVIKVNDCFTLNDVALVDRLRYNLLSISQLVDVNLSVLFHKSDSHVLDLSGKRGCGISHIGNVFQADFSFAQSSLRCLISQSSSELWKWHRRLDHLSFDLLYRLSGLAVEVASHAALLASSFVFCCDSRGPNPVSRTSSFSIAMWS
jgi:hypothetical protein